MSFNGWKRWLIIMSGVLLSSGQSLGVEQPKKSAPAAKSSSQPAQKSQPLIQPEDFFDESEEIEIPEEVVEEPAAEEALPELTDTTPPSEDIRIIPRSSDSAPIQLPPIDLNTSDLDVSIPRLIDLPESVLDAMREELKDETQQEDDSDRTPKIIFDGYAYSNKGKSSVIIKNSIYYEGQKIFSDKTDKLILEKITPKTAILNYDGTRFQVELLGSQFSR